MCAERDAECGHAIFLPGSRVPQAVPGTAAGLLLYNLNLIAADVLFANSHSAVPVLPFTFSLSHK